MSTLIYRSMTDKEIELRSQNRVITDHRDFNLKRGERRAKSRLYPHAGGVYDQYYFGSIFSDTCNCGKESKVGERCQTCGCLVMTQEEKYSKWARIELDYYYCLETKQDALIQFLKDLPIDYVKSKEAFEDLGVTGINKGSVAIICEICQFDLDEETKSIIIDTKVTNDKKASFEGILRIVKNYFPEKEIRLLEIINRHVLVTPAISRMVSFNPFNYRTELAIPYASSVFQAITHCKYIINQQLAFTDNAQDRTLLRASLRRLCSRITKEITSILNPSKENILRESYSTRVGDSGRAPIVGDAELKQDEVALPISLAYELLKIDFITHLSEVLNVDTGTAQIMYQTHSKSTLELFTKYAYTRRVIMNRPPSLHRYNLMSFKIKLTEDAAIHFPILSVGSFNADYDGDCLSFFLVPDEMTDYIDSVMSPATQIRYESSNKFIYTPNHEMIYGLTICTRVGDNPIFTQSYIDPKDIENDYENQIIPYPCDVVLLNEKPTTYALTKLNEILGIDVFTLLGSNTPINMSNIGVILTYINSLENHVDIYQKMIEHALEVITIEGATVPSIKELVLTDLSGITKELQELAENLDNHPENLGLIDEKYQQFLRDQIKFMPEDLYQRVSESNRIKLSQISEMFAPQMMINDDGSIFIADTSQAQGLSEIALRKQAMNNRLALGLKQELTPKGGWAARQIKFAAQGFKMNRNDSDDDNIGIYIPRSKAEGRTTVTGELLGKSDSNELVKVRSVAVTKLNYFTPDMISEVYHVYTNGSNLGLKFGSASAGDVTQTGLSLKHSSQVIRLNQNTKLYARTKCKIRRSALNQLQITEGSNTFNHPVPESFVLCTLEANEGDLIGFLPTYVTPEYASELLLDLLSVRSTSDIENPHVKQWAFNIAMNSGKIHYGSDFVEINGRRLPLVPTRLYTKFEGTEVKEGDFISDGVLNVTRIQDYTNSVQEYYSLFRRQLSYLMSSFNENMLEFMFYCCNAWENDRLIYVGINNKIKFDKSWITQASYESAVSLIKYAHTDYDAINDIDDDLYSNFFLNLLRAAKIVK